MKCSCSSLLYLNSLTCICCLIIILMIAKCTFWTSEIPPCSLNAGWTSIYCQVLLFWAQFFQLKNFQKNSCKSLGVGIVVAMYGMHLQLNYSLVQFCIWIQWLALCCLITVELHSELWKFCLLVQMQDGFLYVKSVCTGNRKCVQLKNLWKTLVNGWVWAWLLLFMACTC